MQCGVLNLGHALMCAKGYTRHALSALTLFSHAASWSYITGGTHLAQVFSEHSDMTACVIFFYFFFYAERVIKQNANVSISVSAAEIWFVFNIPGSFIAMFFALKFFALNGSSHGGSYLLETRLNPINGHLWIYAFWQESSGLKRADTTEEKALFETFVKQMCVAFFFRPFFFVVVDVRTNRCGAREHASQ